MVDYTAAIAQIRSAITLEQITAIVEQYSARAVGSGGILYSGQVGAGTSANSIAVEIAKREGLNIIDTTARGLFLGSRLIKSTIPARRSGRQPPGSFAPACRSGLRYA